MSRFHSRNRQAGASLMEIMVAMSISLVVTASMIALMANSLSTTTRIVKMTKLADDLRVAMQMMTRDVRRSSYNAQAMQCYGNEDCATDGSVTLAGDIEIIGGSCFWFEMDREFNGDSTDDSAGGFRRRSGVVDGEAVGWLEMYTGATQPNEACDGAEDWVAITDPTYINIISFTVDDGLSYTEVVLQDIHGNVVSQKVRKIRMNLQGQLVMDPTIVRRMEDVISVRNNVIL
jgi:type II secretory pathway component PulJ